MVNILFLQIIDCQTIISFNSRFKQNAFKLSVGYKYNRWNNIIRYQLNNETNGLAAHSHGDPLEYTVDQFTSTDLDFNEILKLRGQHNI